MTIDTINEHYEQSQEYNYYNSILNNPDESTSTIPDTNIEALIPIYIANRSNVINNYRKLNEYIIRSTNTKCHKTNTCFEIINYWLNGQVRSGSDDTNNSLINKYKEFMTNDDKIRSYASKIYYIDNTLFKKKKDLYELYSKYDNLLGELDTSNHLHCANLSSIVNDYNNVIGQYPHKDNSNFLQALRDFRNHFERQQEEYIRSCGDKIIKFNSFSEQTVLREVTESSQENSGDVNGFPSESSENIASTFTITLFGTTVGSFLILILFYKITLFGYRLRNKKNNEIIMPNNLGEETYELPVYALEEHENNSRHSTYNVMYQSVENL
ncbi:PIR Superfamily Protein [Plasmodium ovale wallikeri]|uniref:PIR Superfamily Protein n=1 Tax=Plasmodium ovale wallikeri TaxID=864142 RepID=A0A1A9ADX6_PLAOA|nr:PIR Superfamily Protein [Plasmodium ovale wallikeri]SBT58670.1 PIR Superfamily Protein [Plasmodium ovale wallikeri]